MFAVLCVAYGMRDWQTRVGVGRTAKNAVANCMCPTKLGAMKLIVHLMLKARVKLQNGLKPSGAADGTRSVAPANEQRKYQVHLKAPNGAMLKIDPAMILSRPTEMASNPHTFVIEEPGVSRKHLWIGCACNELIFLDLGSTNGTTVNGSSLSPFVPHARPYRREQLRVQLGRSYHFQIEVEPEQ